MREVTYGTGKGGSGEGVLGEGDRYCMTVGVWEGVLDGADR